jgi:integrase
MPPRQRQRGEIENLPSGSLRVRVYAGIDPVTGKRNYLVETVQPGPGAAKEAERVRTRFLAQVDEGRNPKTKATLEQLLDKYLEVVDVDASTKRGYEEKLRLHVRPFLGRLQAGRVGVEELESLYADCAKCAEHCRGKKYVVHHKRRQNPHECSDRCRPHKCKGLSDSSIRQIHWIISGALAAGVRWGWIALNPADRARKPDMPKPNPEPPSVTEAAQLVNEAYRVDHDWGDYVWLAMVTGERRGEQCAIHVEDLDLDAAVLHIHRALYVDDDGELREKGTKTHQQRRVVLDEETVEMLRALIGRHEAAAEAVGVTVKPDAYLFSQSPDGSKPMRPGLATERFNKMAKRLGIKVDLKSLRHYSATELINAGVDVRTVAGRLGHGSGGATTLRVYAAWLSEADQRAAKTLSARMPARPFRAEQQDNLAATAES